MNRRVFVDNLGPATTEQALEELFRRTGKVESVVIPQRPDSDHSPAHAFVVMSSETEASMVIHLFNNTDWNGLRLTVTHAGSVGRLRRAGFGGGTTIAERKNRN